jgi:hypothetical protein
MNPQRRQTFATVAASTLLAACTATPQAPAGGARRHYVLVHGAWHGAWAWQRLTPLLRQVGHTVSAPTLSGLGERAHHAQGASPMPSISMPSCRTAGKAWPASCRRR